MQRVEAAHRYDVPVERGFAFITNTANWSKFWRERELAMTIRAFEPNRFVSYTSTQPGLPDAYHERHFEPDVDGFVYRLIVEYEPRRGIAGLLDRVLLRRGIRRAFERTFLALEQQLVGAP